MLFLESNFDDPAENLALDEALLEQAEAGENCDELLRIWIPRTTAIIVGRSSQVAQEVNVEQAKRLGIPIIRRASGGASVVLGTGCVAYSLILSYAQRPELRLIDEAHQLVMRHMHTALCRLNPLITMDGTCDLVLGDRKINGNSLRCRRAFLLYHGTILVDMDLRLIDQVLKHPPREPDYRHGRRHIDFLSNLHVPLDSLIQTIRFSWSCIGTRHAIPTDVMNHFLREKYRNPAWNFQR